ncbi:MAG: hypothetical protein O6837_04940 [Deltaproteobacteria bacterium]|nr:hypothetical protein [Deltaproteobacteria bacterium]MCZ6547452.1 hypothetical protein [Deltaproteobacteria bacterium]MCZ6562770.1 hypothetical protein [Deltaproteobacteria bacterium]MCZ6620490.1 hypothetical protein [Deltaproteobacteria bacterium]
MPSFSLKFTHTANRQRQQLESDNSQEKRLKAVRKTLGLIQQDPRYPSLNTHEYITMRGANGEKVFESYAENKTPAAFRIFWHYGPNRGEITIIAITPHP